MPFLSNTETIRPVRNIEPEDEPGPTLGEQVGAAFQIENVVGSYLRDVGDPAMQAYDPTFDVMEHLTDEERTIGSRFSDANSPADVDTIRGQLARERDARRIMGEGPLPELAASALAILGDPTTYLPSVGAISKGGSLVSKLSGAALGGAADVALSEAALQATQRERTFEESAYSVLLGGAFGMGIGAGAAALTAKNAIADGIRDATALSRAVDELDPDSIGAARAEIDPSDTRLEPFVGQETLNKMSRYNLAPVSVQMKSSELDSVRRITDDLVTTSLVTQGNVRGVPTAPSVELKIKRYDAVKASAGRATKELHREHKAAGGGLGYTEFRQEIGRAMRRGDQHADTTVAKAAQWMRSNVFDPIKDRAINVGLLPEGVEVKEALSYFSRVYNRQKIKAQRPTFKRRIVDWIDGQQRRDLAKQQELLSEREAKRSELESGLTETTEQGRLAEIEATGSRAELEEFEFSSEPADRQLERFGELDVARGNVAAIDDDITAVRQKADRASSAINALASLVKKLDIADERVAAQFSELAELRDLRRSLRDEVKAAKKAEREAAKKPDLPETTVTTSRGKRVTHRGPMDIITWLRSQGGLQDSGGELKSRDLKGFIRNGVEFAGRERVYGPLVSDTGMRLDDAALRATEAGFFPGQSRASIDDLLGAIDQTVRAGDDLQGRVWREEDFEVVDQLVEFRARDDGGDVFDVDAADQEIARVSDELRSVQRDLGRQQTFVDALGPAGPKYEKFVAQLDELQSTLDDMQARRNDMKRREADLESALKESGKEVKAAARTEFQEFAALRKSTQAAERMQARAGRQAVKLQRSLDAVNRAIERTSNRIVKIETSDVLEDAADQIIDKILGNNAARTDFFPEPLARGPLKERTFHIPDELIEDFLESDNLEVAMRYITTMSADVEMTRAFGRADMEHQLIEIQNEANERIAAASTEAERTRIQDEATRQTKNIKDLADILRNRYVSWGDHVGLKRLGRGIKQYNFVRLLGSATLSSLVDAGKVVMEEGLARSFGGLVADMTTGFKAVRMGRQEAHLAGTALDIVLSTRTRSLADLGERYVAESKFERGLSKTSDYFGIVNLLSVWNEGMKSWASAMVASRILRTTEKLASGGKLSRAERLKLARSGIDEGLAQRIAQQTEHWERHTGGVILGNTEAWDDAVAREAFRNALVADVDRTVITPGAADAPIWVHGSVGSMIAQFKRFSLASTTQLLASGLQTRDIATLNGVLAMVALGMAGTALRDLTKSGEVKDRPANEWIVNGVDRSGALALFVELDALADKLTGGRGAMNTVAGKEPQRFQTRGFAGQLAGPTFGTLDDVQKATTAFFDGDATRKDLDRVTTVMPAQNVFWLRWALEQAKDATGLPEN